MKALNMKTFPGTGSNGKKVQRFLLKLFFLNLNLVVTNEPRHENAENSSPSPTNYLHFILFINCAYLCISFDVQKWKGTRRSQRWSEPWQSSVAFILLWIVHSDEQRQWVPKCHISVKNWISSSWSQSHCQDAILERILCYTCEDFEKNHNAVCFRMNS